MRLWSLHPRYLDTKGLVALWREALLAQKVLNGETRGYRHHPQLERFREAVDPVGAIAFYLEEVCKEGERRGYCFDQRKILSQPSREQLPITRGQIDYEYNLLCKKLSLRDPKKCKDLEAIEKIEPHPLFHMITGGVADWEKQK